MQAIVTKHIGPTNFRGARIKATCQAKSLTLSWDYAMNPDGNHRAAALALATELGWDGRWIGGDLPDGSTAWTLVSDRMSDEFTIAERDPRAALSDALAGLKRNISAA